METGLRQRSCLSTTDGKGTVINDDKRYDSPFITAYFVILSLVLGAVMGSFLNCTAMRIARGETFVKGRSHCMKCGHELSWMDLVPVLSWGMLGGKCRYCGEKISARYPITEVTFALLSMACVLKFGLTVLCLRNYVMLAVLFVVTLTDIETMEIPDSCHVIAAAAWAVTAPFIYRVGTPTPGSMFGVDLTLPIDVKTIGLHVAAGLVFGSGLLALSLIMDHIMKRDTLGGGDIKLIAVVGLYMGFIGTLFVIMLSCITGLVFNVILNSGKEESKPFPFGPWIAISTVIMLFFGDPLIQWYLGLLG